MTLYASLSENVMGEDREKMLEAWDDDEALDRWRDELNAKQKLQSKPGSKGKTPISNENYLKHHAKQYGGEGAAP